MHYVKGVEIEPGHRLRLWFEDGSVRVADLSAHLDGEMFEPLRDLRRFRTARLNRDIDTVAWDNGADMSPDFLYEIGMPVAKVAEAPGAYAAAKTGPRGRRRR